MIDERENLPSASGVEAMLLCRGKWALESTIAVQDDSSDESRSGDRIHTYMAGAFALDESPLLNDDEERVAEKFQADEAALVEEFIGDPLITLREERLWIYDSRINPEPPHHVFSGKPDAVFIGEDAILIVDYKSGWLGATPGPRNPQLRALVVLVNARFKAMGRPIYVAALLRAGKPSVAKYEAGDIAAAVAELRDTVAAGTDRLAPRTPGEKQCRYCRAKAVCPEFNAAMTALAAIETRTELDLPALTRILDLAGPIEKVIEAARAKAKRLLTEDPSGVPGWELTKGQEREKVTDVQALAARVFEMGVPVPVFTAACSITKSALKPLVKAATQTKGKALDDKMEEALAGLTEITVTAPSLKRA